MKLAAREELNPTQLQYLIAKQPDLYKEEFEDLYKKCISHFTIYTLDVTQNNKELSNLITFLAKIIHTYPHYTQEFINAIQKCLQEKGQLLNHDMKMVMCKSLMILRSRKLLDSLELANLFISTIISQCPDSKILRKSLADFIVSDITSQNSKRKNGNLNGSLQNFFNKFLLRTYDSDYKLDDDRSKVLAKVSLSIMMRLYAKGVWNDEKTVNFMAQACFSKLTNIMSMAIHFFLDPNVPNDDEELSKGKKGEPVKTSKDIKHANQVGKKSKSRMRKMKQALKLLKKHQSSKRSTEAEKDKKMSSTAQLVTLLYDPQEFAEKLFQQLQHRNESFELRLATLDLVSKIIGLEQLQIINFFPYMIRYLQPHQSHVTKLLLYVAQATHELIPPEVVKPIILAIANNFITEKNSSHVITVGINAIRELCNRNPLVMEKDLLNDLELYSNYKNKNVVMAARSLINLFRRTDPSLLLKKDRGRLNKDWRDIKPAPFGHRSVKSYIEGIECLKREEENDENESSEGNNSPEHSNLESGDESNVGDDDPCEGDSLSEDIGSCDELANSSFSSDENENSEVNTDGENHSEPKPLEKVLEDVSSNRLLTEEEIEKIRSYQKRKRTEIEVPVKKQKKKDKKKVRKDAKNASNLSINEEELEEELEISDNDDSEEDAVDDGLPSIADIERLHKIPKMQRDERMRARLESKKENERDNKALKMKGRKARKNPHCSTSNKEKVKKKPFMMTRVKAKKKIFRSQHEKRAVMGRTVKNMKRFKKRKR